MERNSNCLIDIVCPKCGSLGPFWIATECWAKWYDSGVEETEDLEYDEEESFIRCVQCETQGLMMGFKTPVDHTCPDCQLHQRYGTGTCYECNGKLEKDEEDEEGL